MTSRFVPGPVQWNHVSNRVVYGADIETLFSISLEGCMTQCLSHTDCRSLEHSQATGTCYLNDITRLEAAVSQWRESESYNYHDFFKTVDGKNNPEFIFCYRIDGLVQERRNSIADALKLRPF